MLGCVYFFELEFSPDICPKVGSLDRMVTLFIVLKGTSILFSIVAAATYILHPLQHLLFVSFLKNLFILIRG